MGTRKDSVIRKAATFRASSIGDALMGKYFLENVHEAYPHARCGIIVSGRTTMLRDVFAAYPWLEIVEANRRMPRSLLRLWKDWRGTDLILTQYAGKAGGRFSLASKIAARILAGTGTVLGFRDASPWNRLVFSRVLPFSGHTAPAELEREALTAARIPIAFPRPTLRYNSDATVLERFSLDSDSYVLVHLFPGNPARGLSPEAQCAFVAALHAAFPTTTLILTGTHTEREATERVIAEVPHARTIAGEASLQEVMNLIANARVTASVDTGMAHIAAQLGAPLGVVSSCIGKHWWSDEQYGKDAALVAVQSETCEDQHRGAHYPACLNAIDFTAFAQSLAARYP